MASNLVKAIRIEQHGGPEVLKLAEVEVPPPAANEVTIRQHAAGLNFIDIYFRTGLYRIRCRDWVSRPPAKSPPSAPTSST